MDELTRTKTHTRLPGTLVLHDSDRLLGTPTKRIPVRTMGTHLSPRHNEKQRSTDPPHAVGSHDGSHVPSRSPRAALHTRPRRIQRLTASTAHVVAMPQAPEPHNIAEYYGPLAWVARYMIDWGHCGGPVRPIRAFTTIIRWFHIPEDRRQQWQSATSYMQPPLDSLTQQHRTNLDDLLDSTTEISLTLDRRKLGLFFASLDDGDIIDGGPFPDWIPQGARIFRPGFAYLWGKWNKHFPDRAPPWPFWTFPRKEVYLLP